MTGSIRDRATFARLRRSRHRVDRGPVTVRFVPDPGAGVPAVAYAIGRHVGGAVVRNRLRRRLRSIVREIERSPRGVVPGSYLISLTPAASRLTYQELSASVASSMRAVGEAGRS